MRVALVQLTSTDDPDANAATLAEMVAEAANAGADFILTPEVSNCVSLERAHQVLVLKEEEKDQTLQALRHAAPGAHVLIGSLAIKTADPEGRFANRSILLGPDGQTLATYDKIHMFDVSLPGGETYRESKGYRPGQKAVVAEAMGCKIGLTVCYDMRFPALYRTLASAGASIITVPSAFTVPTGKAHWHTLLMARAIETGCFILAPAQTGTHPGSGRKTYGHSLVVSPWGEVLADAGAECGITLVDLDLSLVEACRARIPSLRNAREFQGP